MFGYIYILGKKEKKTILRVFKIIEISFHFLYDIKQSIVIKLTSEMILFCVKFDYKVASLVIYSSS